MTPYAELYAAASRLYGSLRGYGRGRIRRAARAAEALPPAALARAAQAAFEARVRDAVARFPAYAAKVRAACGALPREGLPRDPAALPVWTRADQRAQFEGLAGAPCPGAFVHATGGSTGVPLRFYVTRESFEWRTAVSDRGYAWAGAAEGQRSFYVWGTAIRRPSFGARLKAGLHHGLQRRTYFDSFQFDDAAKRRCCAAIDRARPPVLVGYAGNLIELARFVRDNPGALAWRARAVITAAEGLAPGRRELLEAHLGGKVFMSYGSREFMLIGMECPAQQGYHLAADNLKVEVVDDAGRPLPPGATGRILITDLHNAANPFVRYEIGDLGALAPPDEPCPCGRPFPRLARVEGRLQEVLVLADGTRLTALFLPHLMKEFPWVDGYQAAQGRPGEVELRLVCRGALTAARCAPVEAALRPRLGPGAVLHCVRVAALARSASGKTPIVVAGEGAA